MDDLKPTPPDPSHLGVPVPRGSTKRIRATPLEDVKSGPLQPGAILPLPGSAESARPASGQDASDETDQ